MTHHRRALLSALLALLGLCAVPNPGLCEEAPAPKAAPTMNKELMARLIKFTRELPDVGAVAGEIARILGVWSGSGDMPVKLAKADEPRDGVHYFGLPVDIRSRDVLLMVKRGAVVEAYLTDKSATLRVAAVQGKDGVRLVPNEQAAARFQAELALYAKEASEQLPPTPPPEMTEELMARLITRARASKKPATLETSLSKIFGLNDGTTEIPVKQIAETSSNIKHFVLVPEKADSKDVLFVYKRTDSVFAAYYLTDMTGVLRAAAVWDREGLRLITNEQAAGNYRTEQRYLANLADELPPTTPPSAGK